MTTASEESSKYSQFVFTDGGARNNGRPSCTAAWGVFFTDNHPDNDTGMIMIDPSNQKAELYAIKMALTKILNQVAKDEQIDKEMQTVAIVSDSKYSINCCTAWWRNWVKNGWKNYKGEHVSHSTIIKDCLALIEKLKIKAVKIKFIHVNSHCIPPKDLDSFEYKIWYGNYMVDKMVGKCMEGEVKNLLSIPTGKPVYIDWSGKVTEVVEDETDGKRGGTKKSSDDGAIRVTW